jgi:hypothetical protein
MSSPFAVPFPQPFTFSRGEGAVPGGFCGFDGLEECQAESAQRHLQSVQTWDRRNGYQMGCFPLVILIVVENDCG